MLTEKIKATRVTFVVDDDVYSYLSKSHSYTEGDDLWYWESSEDIEWEVHKPCEECGSRFAMSDYACPNNEGYCIDDCYCPEHFPEYHNEQLELPYDQD